MPMAASDPMISGSSAPDGLLLHQIVDQLEIAEVVGRHGVHDLAGAFDELRRLLGSQKGPVQFVIRRARQRRLALQRRADARAVSAGKVGIDLERLLDQRDDRLRVVLLEKGPPEHGGAGRAHLLDEVAAARQLALVIGRHKQVFAALAPVGTGQTEVGDPLEPHVVDHAKREWRCLNDDRSLGDVQIDPEIDGVRIGRQEQGLRIHQLGEDQGRVVRDAGLLDSP